MTEGERIHREILAAMTPAHRKAHVAQERAMKRAQVRSDRALQAAQATFFRRRKEIQAKFDLDIEIARQAYRDAEYAEFVAMEAAATPTPAEKLSPELSDIDDRIDEWHKGGSTQPLHEFLGMTWEEYGSWVSVTPPTEKGEK